jgi:hypothetical protein
MNEQIVERAKLMDRQTGGHGGAPLMNKNAE